MTVAQQNRDSSPSVDHRRGLLRVQLGRLQSFGERSLLVEQGSEALAYQSFEIVRRDAPGFRAIDQRGPGYIIAIADLALERMVRVIDESGDDYLYPQRFFSPIELPQAIRRAVLAAV